MTRFRTRDGRRWVAHLMSMVMPALLALVWPTVVVADHGASFQGLGGLPGGSTSTRAYAISADGSTVVGLSFISGSFEAFRWTASEGMVGLGHLSTEQLFSEAWGVSADGSVIVGRSNTNPVDRAEAPVSAYLDSEAFMWTAAQGMVAITNDPSELSGFAAFDISDDGSTVVGIGSTDNDHDGNAFRWTAADGAVLMDDLPGGTNLGFAAAVSSDGSLIFGQGRNFDRRIPARWTSPVNVAELTGTLPGSSEIDSSVYDVSHDGSIAVGAIMNDANGGNVEAFRWTEAGGMVGLGDLPGGSFESMARGVSDDGSVIVGWSRTDLGLEAFIWDAAHGMRNLKDVLENDLGLDLTGWSLNGIVPSGHNGATDISADGLTIVGTGKNPSGATEAWIAHIPQTLLGDINLDGQVDGLDLNILGDNWQDSGTDWSTGDLNGDGVTDGLDLNIFGANWQAGVPGPGSTIPEPGTLGVLVGLGVGMMVGRRRNRNF